MNTEADVLVVGGGPAGLAAAAELCRLGVKRVVVAEREQEAGGAPRHCNHTGFGVFDMKRLLTGPGYARRRMDLLRETPAELLLSTSVLDLDPGDPGRLSANTLSPSGMAVVSAGAILLTTGCRERSRASMLVPGDRPAGVLTTGSLQQLLFLKHVRPGNRAVVVGAENVSFSAVQSLCAAGVAVAAVLTDHPRHQAYGLYAWYTAGWRGVHVYTRTTLAMIAGRKRVESATLQPADSGEPFVIACDTVVFTGGFTPESDLAQRAGLDLDAGTGGLAVDHLFRTSAPGVFAAGNALRGAEIADTASLEGVRAARSIAAWLSDGKMCTARVTVTARDPLLWIYPNRLTAESLSAATRSGFIFRTASFLSNVKAEVRQDGRLLLSKNFRLLIPNRSHRILGSWANDVATDGGPVEMRVSPQ